MSGNNHKRLIRGRNGYRDALIVTVRLLKIHSSKSPVIKKIIEENPFIIRAMAHDAERLKNPLPVEGPDGKN